MKDTYNNYYNTLNHTDISEAIAFQNTIRTEASVTTRRNPAPRSRRPLDTYTFRDFVIKQLSAGIQPTYELTYIPTGEIISEPSDSWYSCVTFVWWFYNRRTMN